MRNQRVFRRSYEFWALFVGLWPFLIFVGGAIQAQDWRWSQWWRLVPFVFILLVPWFVARTWSSLGAVPSSHWMAALKGILVSFLFSLISSSVAGLLGNLIWEDLTYLTSPQLFEKLVGSVALVVLYGAQIYIPASIVLGALFGLALNQYAKRFP